MRHLKLLKILYSLSKLCEESGGHHSHDCAKLQEILRKTPTMQGEQNESIATLRRSKFDRKETLNNPDGNKGSKEIVKHGLFIRCVIILSLFRNQGVNHEKMV